MYQIIELNYSWADFNDPAFEQKVSTETEALRIASVRLAAATYGRVYVIHAGRIISDAEVL